MSLANSFLLNTEMCNNSLACLKKNHPQKIRIIKQIVNLLRLLISTAAPSIILHSPCTSNFEQWPNSSSLIRGELAHHWFTAVPPMQRNLPALCGCEQYSRRVCMYISCLWLWEHDRELALHGGRQVKSSIGNPNWWMHGSHLQMRTVYLLAFNSACTRLTASCRSTQQDKEIPRTGQAAGVGSADGLAYCLLALHSCRFDPSPSAAWIWLLQHMEWSMGLFPLCMHLCMHL